MARRRMIDPLLWEDEHFGHLSDKAKVLFIACISNADDDGRLSGNYSNLRAIAFRFEDISLKKIEELVKELSENLKRFKYYVVSDCKYIQLEKWEEYQLQREDRRKPSKLPPCPPNADKVQPNDTDCLLKLSKDKLSKDKVIQDFFSYYLLKTGKKYKLSADRKKLIQDRLKDYSIEDMKHAVDNFVQDTWEGRKDRMDLVYCIGIIKKIDKLETWLNYKPLPTRRIPS